VERAFADGAVRLRADGTAEGGTKAVTRAIVERV
jgi:hypothetical protein